ncbi:glycosyltransferase [Shimia thalassica]|uniref:glycosyltransferase n=1 Tax=Shimia thalassica TaxID=1715693 RepID=UPI0027366C1F|nr:glycosyltransferase [Shimia thalassica]MDP2520913.1 glycosyltransferase [Shimia thalassica]
MGYELLGPIVHRWLLGLDQHMAYLDDGETSFLFCARAGVRIKELFEIYLEGRNRTWPENAHMFWISRLALCKGLYSRQREQALQIIVREYQDHPIRSIIMGLLRHAPEVLEGCDLTTPDLDAQSDSFTEWLRADSDVSRKLLTYLTESGTAFDTQVKKLLEGSRRAVLIDSGWQGTGQSLLHHAFPDIDWFGLYVGRTLTPSHDGSIVDRVIGLLFQSESFNPEIPETAISLHRHLFETLLEPNGPSIEEILGGPCDAKAREQIGANEAAEATHAKDPLFLLVREYLKDHSDLDLAEIIVRHQIAMPKLARVLAQPTKAEALALSCKDRSADFGKNLNVPILIDPSETNNLPESYANRDFRIQSSLWPQGQIALEFSGKLRDELQLRSSGLSDDSSYFDFASETISKEFSSPAAIILERPLVAIITRTKNRPILLKRAAESVACQSYDNYIWVIVNDGGDEDIVIDTIDKCSVDRRRIRLVSNSESLGMEAASNIGIRHVDSDYVIIHDDDDALHPNFLEKTVGYLESEAGARYGGVLTGTEYVSEEIRGDDVIIHDRIPYMDWVRNIQLAELMSQNLFAPIAFLYRRKLFDEIGGYNQDLPVLGDWFYNLEFILRADIKVLNETLAYYHHRDRGDSSRSGIYSNSVIGGQSKHEEFAAVFRNMFLRKYAKDNTVAAGLVSSYFTMDLRSRLDQAEKRLTAALEWQVGNAVLSNNPNPEQQDDRTLAALRRAELSYAEADRLWILSQFLHHQSSRETYDLLPEMSISLSEVAELAEENGCEFAPPQSFDETLYLQNNSDVAAAVEAGMFRSGFAHYALVGHKEMRSRTSRIAW